MSTKIRCTCGAMVDVADGVPGDLAECAACRRTVQVPALPPGVRHMATVSVVSDAETMEIPPPPPEPALPSYSLPPPSGEWASDDEEDANDVSPGLVPAAPPPPPEHLARSASVVTHPDVRVEWLRYYLKFPAAIAIGLTLVMLGAVGATFTHPAYAVVSFIGLAVLVGDVIDVRRRFRAGRACPAVVLSERPPRIAVLCDLRTASSPNPMPAVRILWHPLRKLAIGDTPSAGTRLAAVANYVGPVRNHTWRDFEPQLVRAATRDEVEVTRVTNLLAEQDWRTLEDAAASSLKARRPGLYTLWDDNHHGRRRTLYLRFTGTLLTLIVLAALVLPLMYVKKPLGRKLPPGTVPGRVHYDWNR